MGDWLLPFPPIGDIMKIPTPRKLRGKYYTRIRPLKGESFKEVLIPLETDSKHEARIRNSLVFNQRDMIANGCIPTIPWLTNEINTGYTLQKAICDYLSFLKTNGRKETTLERAEFCLKRYKDELGKSFLVKDQTAQHIETFKDTLKGEVSDQTININLTRIRAFINWCVDIKGVLENRPKTILIKVPEKAPSYLTETDMKNILKMKGLKRFWKDTFQLYWETGVRLREIFNGRIDGNWLVVDGEDSKSGRIREIYLQPHHIPTILKIQAKMTESTSSFKGLTDWYSIKFKRVVRKIGRDDLHFHNLRDTFAVMRYLETRDIYQVSKELGHSSVKVTEKYAKFQLRRLEQDFPILAKTYKARKTTENRDFGIRFWDTEYQNNDFTDEAFA